MDEWVQPQIKIPYVMCEYTKEKKVSAVYQEVRNLVFKNNQ